MKSQEKVIAPQLPRNRAQGRRAGRHRQPDHHQGPVRAGVRTDRDRPPLRPDRRHLVVGLLARQVRQGRGRDHQQGRRHRRPQGRARDRGHRIQPGAGRPQAAQPDPARQRRVHRRLGAFRRHAGGAADRHRAQDALLLDRRGDRGDRLEGHALLASAPAPTPIRSPPPACPGACENLGKVWSIIYADYAWGQSTNQESKLYIEKAGGKVLASIPVPLDTKDFVPYVAQIPADSRGRAAGVHRLAVGRVLHPGQGDGPRQEDEDVLVVGEPRSRSIPATSRARPKASTSSRTSRACSRTRTTSTTRSSTGCIGIDDVYCREIGGTRVMDKSHGWQAGRTSSPSRRRSRSPATRPARTSKARSRRWKACR